MTEWPDDIGSWEHQTYLDAPALAPSEAEGFRALRSLASNFYPQPVGHGG